MTIQASYKKQIEQINELNSLKSESKIDEMIVLLSKIKSKSKLSDSLKIELIRAYNYVGDTNGAFNLMGKFPSFFELENGSKEFLQIQLLRIHFCLGNGLYFTGKRLLLQLEKLSDCDGYKRALEDFQFQRSYYCAFNYLTDYSRCIKGLEQLISKYPDKFDKKEYSTWIILIDNYFYSGKTNLAIEKTKLLRTQMDINSREYFYFSYSLAEFYLHLDMRLEANETLESIQKLATPFLKTGDYTNYLRLKANFEIKFGSDKKALKYLNEALAVAKEANFFDSDARYTYYFLNQVLNGKLDLEKKVFLLFYNFYTPYSFLAGRTASESDLNSISPIFKDKINIEPDSDCCVISKELVNSKYNELKFIEEINNNEKNVLDLVGGIYFKDGEKIILSENFHKTLLQIIGAGEVGASHWFIYDFVYRDHLLDPVSGRKRVEKLISDLKKSGFPIIRNENKYLMDFDKVGKIIFPMNYSKVGIEFYIQANFKEFSREDIEKDLNLHSRTANRLLKNLVDEGVLVKEKGNKKITYRFKSLSHHFAKAA